MTLVSALFSISKKEIRMIIKRDKYLNDLIVRMGNGMIKVVTGIRRSGKSYLLFNIFKNYLLEHGVPESHIITIELDQRENRKYRDPDTIYDYIKSMIVDNDQYYVLLDEVQMMNDFEEILNSLLHITNADVYVTGSNSKFLSKDIITEFRGRGDEVHIYPLTFKEFMQAYDGDMYQGWNEYIVYGGLPLVATMQNDEQKAKYLSNLFTETYFIDIIERYHIDKKQEMEDLMNILASSIGSLTNPSKIESTFKSITHSDISINTIRQYIEYLEDAFVISKANRYDVKGRKYIGTPVKYYFEDVGLRNAQLNFRQIEETHVMENVIYNELRARGYSVDVGVVEERSRTDDGKQTRKQLEIDFVCNRASKRYYIQSAYAMPNEEKLEQEQRSLTLTGDFFKRIIITGSTPKPYYNESGVLIMGIYDFLLNEDSLDY